MHETSAFAFLMHAAWFACLMGESVDIPRSDLAMLAVRLEPYTVELAPVTSDDYDNGSLAVIDKAIMVGRQRNCPKLELRWCTY